jgi:hypothetical protein
MRMRKIEQVMYRLSRNIDLILIKIKNYCDKNLSIYYHLMALV